ncbi:MAG: response regulator [Bacteroidia bacterium]
MLADDDMDDRFFFDKALKVLPIPSELITVEDGAMLMEYLSKNATQLPDVLFLDLNMPRKNGSECLGEIKKNNLLKHLPVIIYSTSLHEDVADVLYKTGAHYYIRKGGMADLEKTLLNILTMIKEDKFVRPPRNKFILSILAF